MPVETDEPRTASNSTKWKQISSSKDSFWRRAALRTYLQE
jgi:hypothetical protein